MPTIRRCCIIGCSSNSREKPNLQFFQFPKPESQFHNLWKQACLASLSRILPFKKPVVCALHFSPKCIGGRRLTYSAIPTIRLDVPSNLKDVEQKAMADEIERSRKCAYINAVVYEWLVRANLNPNLRGSITHGMIKDKADDAKTIINLESFMADNRWLNRFRETHLLGFATKLADRQLKPLGTSLWIPDIVKDLEHLFPPTSADRMENVPEQYFSYMQQYGEYNDDDERYRLQNQSINQSRNNSQNYNNNNNNNNTSHKVAEKRTYEQHNSDSNYSSPQHSSTSLSPPLMGFSPIKRPKLTRGSSSPETIKSTTPSSYLKNNDNDNGDGNDDDVQVITQPLVVQDLTADDDIDVDEEIDRLSSTKIDSSLKHINSSTSGQKSISASSSSAAAAAATTTTTTAVTRKPANVIEALKYNSPRYVLKLKNTSTSNRNGTPDYVSRISPKGFSDGNTDSGYNSASNSNPNVALAEHKELQTYEDALEYLKPLEDFVLIKENFRAIGLISQLEIILKRGVVNKTANAQD